VGVGFLVGFGVAVVVGGGSVGAMVISGLGGREQAQLDGTSIGRVGSGGNDGRTLDPGIGVTGVLINGVDDGPTLVHAATAAANKASRASLVKRNRISLRRWSAEDTSAFVVPQSLERHGHGPRTIG